MAISITGKLNKAAKQFAAQDSTGFSFQLGQRYYDRETKKEEWTNYSVVVFAKAPAQVQFYQNSLVENAIVEVSGDKCKIRQFQGQNGLILSIEILDAKLGYIYSPNSAQNQPQQAPVQQPVQQQQFAQAPQYAPQQAQYQQPQQQPQQRQAPPQNFQPQYGQPSAGVQAIRDFDAPSF